MNLLDAFFFLFQTNAKQAAADVDALDKSTKQVEIDLNKTGETADKTTLSFSKLALAGVAALESYASLKKLKDGIVNAVNYNAEIEKTAKLTGINSRELAIWNGIVARAGGNPGGKEYLSFISRLNQQYAGLGVNQRIGRVNHDLAEVAERIKTLNESSPGTGYQLAQKLGIGDDLYLALKNGKNGLEDLAKAQATFDNTTDQTTESSLKLQGEWSLVGAEFRSFFNDMIPLAEIFTKGILALGAGLRIVGQGAMAAYHATAALFDVMTFDFSGAAKQFDQIGQSGKNAFDIWYKSGQYLGGTGQFTPGAGAPPPVTGSFTTPEDESRAFWKAQGYTDAQVAALLSNERSESRFRSDAIGDNGSARGIFQWHEPRRARILAGTGIDVAQASHEDQLRAAAWEMEQTGTADRLRAAQTPRQGASVLTAYEAPANPSYQAFIRGQGADDYYAQMMANGQGAVAAADSTSVPAASNNTKTMSIGAVTIHSQATDAKGIARDLRGALNQEFDTTVGAFDDGVAF